jgi:hypothetical protein
MVVRGHSLEDHFIDLSSSPSFFTRLALEVAHDVKGIAIQAGQFEFYFLHCSKYIGTFRNSQLKSLSNCMPSNVLVSGAGSIIVNGTYEITDESNGKPYYVQSGGGTFSIYWDDSLSRWVIAEGGDEYYESYEDVATPDLVVTWSGVGGVNGGWSQGPAPTVTALTPAQNTFGLPAATVALLTSRFGSVANFLRLRNQGQI